MAPRLSHKKTRTGCKRCKSRKVKCDEEKPKCGACTRHNVTCEYQGNPYENNPSSESIRDSEEHCLELRLMQEWMAYTSQSLTTISDFWKLQCPIYAFEFRHLLDAMFALTALYASRQRPRCWSSLEGRMVNIENPLDSPDVTPETGSTMDTDWKAATKARKAAVNLTGPPASSVTINPGWHHDDIVAISRRYFSRALEGHHKIVSELNHSNVRAAYLSSILICCYSLFTLNEETEESLQLDPLKWFALSRGTTIIVHQWQQMVGDAWFVESGGMYGEPDMSDAEELFHERHREGWEYLLEPVDGDCISEEDLEAYESTLSYFGLFYKGIVHSLEPPLATGRRMIAMPPRLPLRFTDLVESYQPRAAAMLAHIFAAMKLAENTFPWFKGIAERQVPPICNSLPPAWQSMVQWPLQVVRGDVSTMPLHAL